MTRKCTLENVNRLKTAYKLVVMDVGGLEAAASITRVRPTHLSDYGNIASEKVVPIDVVMDLEMITGEPHVTTAMAGMLGYKLVAIEECPTHEVIACLQRIAGDNGELFAKAVHALGGGKLTAGERRSMKASALDMQRAASELISVLSQGDDDS